MQGEFERLSRDLRENEPLRREIWGDGTVDGVIARARAAGYALTDEECASLRAASSTLSDSDLDQVVGGFSVWGAIKDVGNAAEDGINAVGNGINTVLEFNENLANTVANKIISDL